MSGSRRSQRQNPDTVATFGLTGGLIVNDVDGSTRVTVANEQIGPLMSADTGPTGDVGWLIQTSINGSDVAVESIAQLLGVEDSDISSVPRISAVGNTPVVAVTLKQRNADGVPIQMVLVGTPRT